MKDLYGSNVPLFEFIKLNLTISLRAHTLFPVRGSLIHYLYANGNPLGMILG